MHEEVYKIILLMLPKLGSVRNTHNILKCYRNFFLETISSLSQEKIEVSVK